MGFPEQARRILSAAAVTFLLAGAASARPQRSETQSPEDPRRDLEAVQRALDRSVGSVSRTAAAHAFGVESCRGYHVNGYGAVFVVPPRALPVGRADRGAMLMGFDGDPFENGIRALEDGLQQIDSDEVRQNMQNALEELRRSQQRRARAVEQARADLRRAQQREQLARREVREKRNQLDQQTAERDAELKAVLESAVAYQREAERAREAAELALRKALEEAQREVHIRVDSRGPRPAVPPVPPAPTSPVAAVEPPVAPLPPVPGPEPFDAAVPQDLLPPAPPWSFWFETEDEGETRSADEVVSSVGNAVTAALEAQAARLKAVRPEESVIVAVDFVPRGTFMAARRRPSRTLVIRVRKKELEDRLAGKLSAEEFRRRVEYVQY